MVGIATVAMVQCHPCLSALLITSCLLLLFREKRAFSDGEG